MELQDILQRFSEGLESVDQTTEVQRYNNRTKVPYIISLFSLNEKQVVSELVKWWQLNHGDDFTNPSLINAEVPYINNNRIFCDLTINSDNRIAGLNEWGIEIKLLHLIGDNGKNNDYGLQKVLSPYRKDRSLLFDIEKLRQNHISRRKAIICVGFNYSLETVNEVSSRYQEESMTNRINNIRNVCIKNNKTTGDLHLEPMIEIVNAYLTLKGYISENYLQYPFTALRHPCGGQGSIFGWELLNNQ